MYQPMVDDYNFLTVANQPYRVAWKSVEAGRTDSVLLLTPFAQLPDSLHFETNSRTPVPHHEHACGAGCADNGAAILPVTGGEHNKTYQIYPVQTRRDSLGNTERKYAGKLNVVSYHKKEVEVVLVPVNTTIPYNIEAINGIINQCYHPAVATFNVTLADSLQYSGFDNSLDTSGFKFYNAYNPEMRNIIGQFKRSTSTDENTYYMFVVQSSEWNAFKGFMPKGRQFGFIIQNNNSGLQDFSRTVAHELGHGAFYLNHPFEDHKTLTPGETDNLMDYGDGTRLHKYQWDIIHNPGLQINWFNNEEQGQLVSLYKVLDDLSAYTTHDGKYLTFVNNRGVPVTLVANQIKSLTFATGGETYQLTNDFIPIGTLTHFSIETLSGENLKVKNFHNCSDGRYYSSDSQRCNDQTDIYFNPADTINQTAQQLSPIVLRHARKEGRQILHVVRVGINSLNSTNNNPILAYDHFLPSFFNIETGQVKSRENVITVDFTKHSLSDAFGMSYYLQFVNDHPEEAEYDNISSFYISGLAVLMQKLNAAFQDECNGNKMLLALRRIKDRTGLPGTGLTTEANSVELLIQHIHNGQYYSPGLSREAIAQDIARILLQNDLVREYNAAIGQIQGDWGRADTIVNWLFSTNKSLLNCEYAGLIFENPADLLLVIERTIRNSNFLRENAPTSRGAATPPSSVSNYEERVILKLLNLVPQSAYPALLQLLEKKIPGIPESTPVGESYYWSLLVDGIDNSIIDGNGRVLMDFLFKVYASVVKAEGSSSAKAAHQNLLERIDQITTGGPQDRIHIEAFNNDPLPIIPYNYTGVLNRLFDINWRAALCNVLAPPYFCGQYGSPINPAQITEVQVTSTGRLEVYQRNKLIFYTLPEGQTQLPKATFKPFDPVILDKKSSFGDAQDLLNTSSNTSADTAYVIIPAIGLLYLEENAVNQTAADVAFTLIDVATIALPVPKITLMSRVVGYMDKASSVLSLAATYAAGSNTIDDDTKNLLNITSAVIGLPSLGHDLVNGVSRMNVAGKVSKSDAAGGLNVQSKNQRLGQLMDHVEQRARDTDGNYAAGYQNERVREYAADVIAKNSDDYPGAERVARVLDILGGGQWDFFLLLRQRLTTLGLPNPGHLPDVIRNAGFTPAQLNDLKNFLLADNNRLLAFHNNLFRNSPNSQTNNMVTAYKYLLDKQLPPGQLLDVQRLGRWCDDMDARPGMRAFLEATPNNEGFTKWAALNHVSTPSEKALVEWIEGLWSSSYPGVDVGLPAGGKTNIHYLNSPVAEINAAGAMDIGPNVHNFGSANVAGSEIRVISPDGSSALVHRQGTGSKILRCACFPAGTPVHTPSGTVPIERLQPDDEIMAYDTQKKDTVVSQVRQVARKTWYSLMRIVTPGDTLWATGNHPFYIPALQQYLPADSLRRGMQLLALTGALLTVQSVAAVDTTVSVYNFEVAEHHNYYVGNEGVLVHNTNGTCPLWVAILRKNKPDGGIIDATEGVLDILQTQALRADIVQAFIDGNVDFFRFFTQGLDINNPADLVVAQRRVRAWGVLSVDRSLRTHRESLEKIAEYLSYFDEAEVPNVARVLKAEFEATSWGFDFIDSFIGGPLRHNELDELTVLRRKKARLARNVPPQDLIESELSRHNLLVDRLGDYVHASNLDDIDSGIAIRFKSENYNPPSTANQDGDAYTWYNTLIREERIYGAPPVTEGPPHDFIITLDGELRIGLGHFHLSGNADEVLAAGRIKVNNEGKIWWMDGTSGHYLPGIDNLDELDAMRAILIKNNLTAFPGE